MAMSWGFTPLCRLGNDRYRLTGGTPEIPPSSGSLSTTQCGIIAQQLPPDTSVVLSTAQQDGASSHPRPTSPSRPQVSSANLSGSETSSDLSVTSNHEDRIVRRSPRLAQTSRVSYRDSGDSQSTRRRNHWGSRVQEMWNNERNQSNASQQSNPNYSVYNYDGQVTPCVNVNATSSISVIYNNKNVFSNVSLLRYPPTIPFTRPPGYSLNSVKTIPKNVTIKSLDFYEVVTTLIQKEIIPEGMRPLQETYSFVLKTDDAKNLLDKKRKPPYLIQLRFCKLDDSCEQNDYYPTTHQVAINHRFIILPGLDTLPRGAMRPMDITHFCQLSSQACNFITIRCLESCKVYITVVQKYTSDDLLGRLEEKPHIKEEDTVSEIKKKLQDDQADDGIAAATLQFSLLCPLSRLRIKLPCRASTCTHLQCFDAATYLKLNECKPKWSCPVCYQPALYKNLVIDGYFKKVIDDNIDADKIELKPDGTWTLVDGARKKIANGVEKVTENTSKDKSVEDPGDKTVYLDSDDDTPIEETSSRQENRANSNAPVVVPCHRNSPEVVTLSDDDSNGGDSPEVTGSTYPTFENPSGGVIATSASNTGLNRQDDLSYFDNLLQGIIEKANRQKFPDSFSNFHPIDHSSHLYIPLTRTPIPTLPSSLTVTCMSNNELRSNSGNRSRRSNSSKGTPHKSRSVSKASNSKKKKISKDSQKNSKKNSSDVVKHKRRRILSVSSDSSDSNRESRKKSKSKSGRRQPGKQKSKCKKPTSDTSEGDKSSSSSTSSKSSNSSVNLITSSDASGSDSDTSNDSNSSSSDDSENSDDSFTVRDVQDQVEESSRVLRSALRRHTRKK